MSQKKINIQGVKTGVIKHTSSIALTSKKHAKSIVHTSAKPVLKTAKITKTVVKKTHTKVAKQPHKKLTAKYSWYSKWHSKKYHNIVHTLVLTTYLLIVGLLVLSAYQAAKAASDITVSWNFANAADYTTDDGLTIAGNSAHFSVQEYLSDTNTKALYHLNEVNGNNISDSSLNTNNGTLSDTAFMSGQLNNALSFNGINSLASIPNSASLALSQSNTLEAWTKLNRTFNATSDSHRQSIVDKGDYKLYYDNDTGKIVYELANATSNDWMLVAGDSSRHSWDATNKPYVWAHTKIGNNIYAGIGGSGTTQKGMAEVWKYNGTNWSIVGGGNPAVNNSWTENTYTNVYALTTDGVNLYAGLGNTSGDGEVWKYNGTNWTQIGGDNLNSGWTDYAEQVWSLDYFGGKLYAGLGNTSGDGEVWQWDGNSWTMVGGDGVNNGWTTGIEQVPSLAHAGGDLYAGLGRSAGEAQLWKFSGGQWTMVGGNGVNGSWAASTFENVYTILPASGKVYVGLGDTAGDGEVWQLSGSTWTKLGGDGVNNSWNTDYEWVHSLETDGTHIYAGLGSGTNDGEVWMYNGSSWEQIGGDSLNGGWTTAASVNSLFYDGTKLWAGMNSPAYDYTWDGNSWTQVGYNGINGSWSPHAVGTVSSMYSYSGYLYAGLGTRAGAAVVYRYDGNVWQMIGGQNTNNSWDINTYEKVESITSYKGKIYVGLGLTNSTSGNNDTDGEVWQWNGSSWQKIGGDGVNNSWAASATNLYGEIPTLISDGIYLYAGTASSGYGGEVWRYDGNNWERIGGNGINSDWSTTRNRSYSVNSLSVFKGKLIAGVARNEGTIHSEVWQWNGSSWSQIGGDGFNGSWTGSRNVFQLISSADSLYVATGTISTSPKEAAVWQYDGASWTKIGGDGVNNSWTADTFTRVESMALYNGKLYAGLGVAVAPDGASTWEWNGSSWTAIGGTGINNGWSSAVEEVASMATYKGKLYAGLGNTASTDALVYSYGDNGYLESSTSSFNTDWRHVAGTYDGTTMKLYIDGVLNNQTGKSLTLPSSDTKLYIGGSQSGVDSGKSGGSFDGLIDEVRISDVARTDLTSKPYFAGSKTVTVNTPMSTSGVWQWKSFNPVETLNGGFIKYRFSVNTGNSWLYWNGSTWAESTDAITQSNDATTINDHLAELPVTYSGLKWQAILTSDGTQLVQLNSLSITSTGDNTPPSDGPSDIHMYKASGGSEVAEHGWTNGASPQFSWSAGNDNESGVNAYCAYLGTDNTANPQTTKGLLGTSPTPTNNLCQFIISGTSLDLAQSGLLGTPLTSSDDTYYLRILSIDNAGNLGGDIEQFSFRFDNTPPQNPEFITAPSGFVKNKAITLTWMNSGPSAPSDPQSGIAGLQYRIGSSGAWYGINHDGSGSINDLLPNTGNYTFVPIPDFDNLQEGINTVYVRTWDTAGNISTAPITAIIKINTNGSPSEPQNLVASPTSNTSNSFEFTWERPASFVGDASNLSYCYTVNTLPSESTCNYTGAGSTSLPAGPYATQHGSNTLYLVAKDEANNINYSSYTSVMFSANTTAPGIPKNIDIVDVSVKSTNNWRLALTWEEPDDIGAGVTSYKLERSLNGASDWSFVGSSSSTTYIDANLQQETYYYRVKACDSTNNCSADSTVVNSLPTGKFTSPALMVAEPSVGGITTKKSIITWSTDRNSDSKIALGTTSGQYASSEIGNSSQVSAHTINLDNLAAGTTYYYVAKWTDEDGNTGTSQEYTFTTAPAPALKEVTTPRISLNSATIKLTSSDASKIDLVFGKTEAFGGIQTINTALGESTYTMDISGLDDGTKYFYKLISYDVDGNKYDGSIFSFTTPARPRISNLQFQPVVGEPTSTQEVSWDTNVPSTSMVSYGKTGATLMDSSKSDMETHHVIIIKGLEDDSQYDIVAQSRDAEGNLATSDIQSFHTALDTRPPVITEITVEPSIRGVGAEARGQIVVSWHTDEPSTSQVAYGEGTNITTFPNKSAEDTSLSTEHVVIISDLPTSKVYSVQPISRDKSTNAGTGETQSAIIGRASDSILTIIFNTLKGIFGF